MAVDLYRVAAAAFMAASTGSKRESGLASVRAVAAGVALGTVGRVAAERGVRLARQRMRHALARREAEDVDPQRRDQEREESYGQEPVPVITKRVVPRELVRIVKGTRREDAQVVDEARRERIDVERDLER